jgi:putative nucleotidyltransferase with HDIG domain
VVDEMIKILNEENQSIDTSGNHVCKYHLLAQTDDYEVIRKIIKKGALTIIQKEECDDNTNVYYIVSGMLEQKYTGKRFGPGSSFVFKDLNEALIFEVLEDSELIWVAKNSVYDTLINENDMIIETLNQVQEKDHYTKDHSLRVSDLAKKLALRAKVTGRCVSNVAVAAIAHDIGKVKIEDEILNKPGRLDDQEYKKIKKHVVYGYDIVKDMFPSDITDIILQHHERLDGSGYPYGLIGDEITYGAKMLAVVDSYDAMRTERPYKKGLSKEKAIEELIRCKGTFYDAELIDLFIDLLDDID